MIDTSIHTEYFVIYEPVTAITDYIITALCLYFFMHLKGSMKAPIIKNWNLFFLFFGIATALSGSAHAFFATHEGLMYNLVWLTGQAFIIPSTYFAQKATLHLRLRDNLNKGYWNLSCVIQLIIFCVAVFIFRNFFVVIVNAVVGLIPVMVIHFRESDKNNWSKWVAYGILISFLTAFVNGAKLSLHEFFNYKDISHVLIMISLIVIFIGMKMNALNNKMVCEYTLRSFANKSDMPESSSNSFCASSFMIPEQIFASGR
jgi:hypothetical protein